MGFPAISASTLRGNLADCKRAGITAVAFSVTVSPQTPSLDSSPGDPKPRVWFLKFTWTAVIRQRASWKLSFKRFRAGIGRGVLRRSKSFFDNSKIRLHISRRWLVVSRKKRSNLDLWFGMPSIRAAIFVYPEIIPLRNEPRTTNNGCDVFANDCERKNLDSRSYLSWH